MSDSRINVRVSAELKRRVEHVTVDQDVSLTSAVTQAMELWLDGFASKVRRAEHEFSEAGRAIATKFEESGILNSQDSGNASVIIRSDESAPTEIICKVDHKPLHLTLERLLLSDQRPYIEAVMRWAETWLESSAHDPSSEEADIVSRFHELAKQGRRQAAAVLGIPANVEGNEQPIRPDDEKSDRRHGKRAG